MLSLKPIKAQDVKDQTDYLIRYKNKLSISSSYNSTWFTKTQYGIAIQVEEASEIYEIVQGESMQKVYGVFENTDTIEGRGRMELTALFTRSEDATKLAHAHEPYGYPDQFNQVRELCLYDNLKDCEDGRKIELRERALAKLTQEEKKVLGL